MAWVTIATTGMRYGNLYFQYDNSQGTTSRYCRLYFEFYSGSYGDWNMLDTSINGAWVGTIRINSNGEKWTGWLDAGYRSWWCHINWWDIGYTEYSGGGTVPSGVVAPTKPTVSAAVSSTTQNSVTYGTTSFGTPSSGTVYLYGGTSASPTTQLASKTSTGDSTYNHTGLTGNTKYYYRSRASNGSANSDYSADATAVTKPATPSACSLTVTGETTATLSVTSPSQGSALSMTVYYKLNNGSYASMGTITQGGTITKTLTGLTAGTNYTATVYISTTSGNSGEKTSSQVTTWKKPQGLTVSAVAAGDKSVTATGSITSYGVPASESERALILGVSETLNSNTVVREKSAGAVTSGSVTLDNNSGYSIHQPLNMQGNSTYYPYIWVTNNKVSTMIWSGTVTTKASISNGSITQVTNNSAQITITIPSQGTANTITAHYRIKEGETGTWGPWTGNQTITPSAPITYTITGLKPNTTYVVEPNVNNTVGGTSAALVTFTTKPALYGSVNGQSKAIINLYGSVGGQTKRITKMYGSLNGVTKRLI